VGYVILPRKDFFTSIKGNIEFFQYLLTKSTFILNDVVKDTGINYSVLHKRIRYWELHGYIEKESIASLGGPIYEYNLTEKAKAILKGII
jgi:DNA-binding HxlR family transcriptional regulator